MDGVEDGGAKAGMEFLGDGGAADDGTAFEDERLEAGAREVKSGDEGILAGADDDDVARGHLSRLQKGAGVQRDDTSEPLTDRAKRRRAPASPGGLAGVCEADRRTPKVQNRTADPSHRSRNARPGSG